MSDKLEYRPPPPSWWACTAGWRFGRRLIVAAIFAAGLMVLVLIGEFASRTGSRAYTRARFSMYELNQFAQEMIGEAGPGVATVDGRDFITSFDAFYDYVARRRPEVVGPRDASNPFPGILPGERYGHAPGPTTAPADLLFWSEDVYYRPVGSVQPRITAGGMEHDLLPSDVESPRAPAPPRAGR